MMKRLILVAILFLFLLPGGTIEQEPKKVPTSHKKEQVDTTKIDSIMIQQKTSEIKIDSNLSRIKEQNAKLDSIMKEHQHD